jgi:ATP-dependent Clp protease protease subunit
MGAVLLAGGDAGRRATLPNSTHMIHQASGGARGQTKDVKIEAAEQERLENRLIDILAKHTKKPAEQIRIDIDRDNYMDSQKALEYGLVDRIITKIGEKK